MLIKFLLCNLVLVLLAFVIHIITPDYEKCYSEMEYQGRACMGCCSGLLGGTKASNYLSETCVECPHLVLINNTERKEN